MMKKLLTHKISKLTMLTVLLFSAFDAFAKVTSIKKLKLDRITIKNDFGQRIAVQATWRDRNGAHTTQITNTTINKGAKVKVKGPMLGYGIKEVTATESAIVATVLAPPAVGASLIAILQGTAKSHGNKFFVVKAGSAPKGIKNHKAVITGYKNEKAYNDAMAKKAAEKQAVKDEINKNKQVTEKIASSKEKLSFNDSTSVNQSDDTTTSENDNDDDLLDDNLEDNDFEDDLVAAQ